MKVEFIRPKASQDDLVKTIQAATNEWPNNRFCKKIESGDVTLQDYQKLLATILYQPFYSASTLALAGSNCGINHIEARDYLLKHAEEEKLHWKWILDDLQATNYPNEDPSTLLPPGNTHAYVAFNHYIATKKPFARLAIALMLETLGGTYSKHYATLMCKKLQLTSSQASFFFGHGDTDVGHTKELWEIINSCHLTPEEWAWMSHAASVAFNLYFRIYDELLE